MNTKWKVALLALLGFSTAACCGTKKAAKNEDKKVEGIVTEEEDPRIMLMYGIPSPDGAVVRPFDENGNEVKDTEAVQFPDGSIAKPITEEEAQKRVEEIRAEKEAMKNQTAEE